MQTRKQSLLNYLRTPDPDVSGQACRNGQNSKSSSHSYETPRELCEWEEFEYDTLKEIYGGGLRKVLEHEFDLQDFSAIPEFPFRRYFDENSLDSLLIKWNHSMVSEALAKAQAVLDQPHDNIFMVRGGQAESPWRCKKWKPDWGCVRLPVAASLEKQKNLLPGDTKVSAKWSSSMIELGELEARHKATDWIRPLNQIYSYCLRNETRYGYIITDAELVVVRVRLGRERDSQRSFESFGSTNSEAQVSLMQRARATGYLELKAVPWTKDEDSMVETSEDMTVNLALWWLHLIATGHTNIGENYGALRDAVWGSNNDDQIPSLGYLALSQPKSTPNRKVKKRSKAKANGKKRSTGDRPHDMGSKVGRSKGPRSGKGSFGI